MPHSGHRMRFLILASNVVFWCSNNHLPLTGGTLSGPLTTSNVIVMGTLTACTFSYIQSNIIIFNSETINSNLTVYSNATFCNNVYVTSILSNTQIYLSSNAAFWASNALSNISVVNASNAAFWTSNALSNISLVNTSIATF